MRRDRLTPGLILLVIGAFLLLKNFGYLHIHWSNIIHLWPIFLVIGGINLIFANNRTVWASILKITVTVAGVALILLGNFGDRYTFFPEFAFHNHNGSVDIDDDDDDTDTAGVKGLVKIAGASFYHVPYTADVKTARLEITGGANTFNLSDTTSQLFTADVKDNVTRYEMQSHKEDSVSVIDFKMRNAHKGHFNWNGTDKDNKAAFKLNSAPLWDLTLKAGAADVNFDLSKFKVRNFRLSGGAASFTVKFGAPIISDTNINVSSGVSDIKISVPKDAACSIISSTGLSDNNFNGFTKTSDNHYQTPGFDQAKKRIYINISGGMSDFSVSRY